MKKLRIVGHTVRNLLHTILLFGGMVGILALLGYAFFGTRTVLWVTLAAVPVLLVGQQVSPQLMLRLYGARPLQAHSAPTLHRIVGELANRANLPRAPQLYYIPSRMMNAFTVGTRQNAAIGVTDGLLRNLNQRELTGVLAHEIAHARDSDMRVMGFADMVSRITGLLSRMGQLLLIFNLPMLMMGQPTFSWVGVLLLISAPTLTGLLQLALSRTREFQADLTAVQLTADPEGLAGALHKMETRQAGLLGRILMPGYRTPDPSLLRSHPHTEARIERLLSLRETNRPRITEQFDREVGVPGSLPGPRHGPRWHATGIWR